MKVFPSITKLQTIKMDGFFALGIILFSWPFFVLVELPLEVIIRQTKVTTFACIEKGEGWLHKVFLPLLRSSYMENTVLLR